MSSTSSSPTDEKSFSDKKSVIKLYEGNQGASSGKKKQSYRDSVNEESASKNENDVKKDGGWTLEMIDTKSPCAGISNWKASVNVNGGSPGKKNSVDAINNDQLAPKLRNAYTIDDNTIILVYDEPVDSLSGATA